MGTFDGAETCELVELFLLSQLTHLDVNVELYRDDGLVTCTKSPKQVEAIKKEMCKIFKHNSLRITIEANKNVVDSLDITLDLRTAIYRPYKKPNSNLSYIHKYIYIPKESKYIYIYIYIYIYTNNSLSTDEVSIVDRHSEFCQKNYRLSMFNHLY